MSPIPRATYRVQLHRDFNFRAVRAIVPYLAQLGVSHLYTSPFLKARPGSLHGYDIIDHESLNPEIGTSVCRSRPFSGDRICGIRRDGDHRCSDASDDMDRLAAHSARRGHRRGCCAGARCIAAGGLQTRRGSRRATGSCSFFSQPARHCPDRGRADVLRPVPTDSERPRTRRGGPHVTVPITARKARSRHSAKSRNLLRRAGIGNIPHAISGYPTELAQGLSGGGSRGVLARCVGCARVARAQ